jgi:hypothetical protein
MTLGEGGSAGAFVALAFFSIVVAAKAYTPEYAFHAYLFAAGKRRRGICDLQPLFRSPGRDDGAAVRILPDEDLKS